MCNALLASTHLCPLKAQARLAQLQLVCSKIAARQQAQQAIDVMWHADLQVTLMRQMEKSTRDFADWRKEREKEVMQLRRQVSIIAYSPQLQAPQ